MKNYIYILFLSLLAASCGQQSASDPGNHDDSINAKDQPVHRGAAATSVESPPLRDLSINSSNAYNTLFLDSNSVEVFIKTRALPENEALEIRNFYNPRNFEYAWFSEDGLTAEAKNFWNAFTYSGLSREKETPKDKSLALQLDTLLNATDSMSISPTDSSYSNSEIAITQKFIQYYRNENNLQKLSRVPISQLLPAKKMTPVDWADSLLKFQPESGSGDALSSPYNALKKQLAVYLSIGRQTAGDTILVRSKLRKGLSSPVIPAIKKRLQWMGYMAGTDTSSRFNDSLDMAVKSFQQSRGWKPDGLITNGVIREMNMPMADRIGQLIINMNRMLWLPAQLPDNYIQVNIPEFLLKVYEGKNKVFDMKVIAGDEGTRTTMFSGDLNQVVFSPSWNLPVSIIQKEILPAIKRDPAYLKKHKMEITGKQGDLPLIRQIPGSGNALGKVKFLFPNSYDIYLHDTEAKGLFNAKVRAFSHGCIRLADAEKMANYVLRNDSEWGSEKIKTAMDGGKEKFVKVKQPVPVIITYFTVWVDEAGKINFREDVYGHDKKTAGKLFLN